MHCLKGTESIAGATVMAATCRGDGLGVDVSASAWHRWDRRVSGKYTRTRRPATMWGGDCEFVCEMERRAKVGE